MSNTVKTLAASSTDRPDADDNAPNCGTVQPHKDDAVGVFQMDGRDDSIIDQTSVIVAPHSPEKARRRDFLFGHLPAYDRSRFDDFRFCFQNYINALDTMAAFADDNNERNRVIYEALGLSVSKCLIGSDQSFAVNIISNVPNRDGNLAFESLIKAHESGNLDIGALPHLKLVSKFGYNYVAESVGYRHFPRLEATLPGSLIAGIGIVARLTFFTLCAFFIAKSFDNSYNVQKFLTLDSGAGRCNSVPYSWTLSNLLADSNGNWQGQTIFNPVISLYAFNLFNLQADPEQYGLFMTQVKNSLSNLGAITKTQDFAANMMLFNSWSVDIPTQTRQGVLVNQHLSLTANSLYIFFKDQFQGTISSIGSDCKLSSNTVSYNRATGECSQTFSYSALQLNPSCKTVLKPSNVGYNPALTGDSFTITFGTRALFASLAVNNQITGPRTIQHFIILKSFTQGIFGGVQYNVEMRFDPDYPEMKPIYCIGPAVDVTQESWRCLIKSGSSYGIPFLNHAGMNASYPVPCDCSLPSGQLTICDSFNFTFGYFIWDATKNKSVTNNYPSAFRPFLPALEYLFVSPAMTARQVNALAFPVTWTALFGQNKTYSKSPPWRQRAYAFTGTRSFGTAAFVVFTAGSTYDQGISLEKYQMTDGACSDSVSLSEAAFEKMAGVPFGDVTEVYFTCLATLPNALLSAIGIGVSTGGTAVALLLFFCVQLAILRYKLSSKIGNDEVDNGDEGEESKNERPSSMAYTLVNGLVNSDK